MTPYDEGFNTTLDFLGITKEAGVPVGGVISRIRQWVGLGAHGGSPVKTMNRVEGVLGRKAIPGAEARGVAMKGQTRGPQYQKIKAAPKGSEYDAMEAKLFKNAPDETPVAAKAVAARVPGAALSAARDARVARGGRGVLRRAPESTPSAAKGTSKEAPKPPAAKPMDPKHKWALGAGAAGLGGGYMLGSPSSADAPPQQYYGQQQQNPYAPPGY